MMWSILLVEDEPFVRRSIRNAIPWEEHGFTIAAEASHGLEAMEQIEAISPDIVISDVFMPYMNGIELLQQARKNGSEAAFIMLTCAGEFEYARMALEYGASSYILKLSMDEDQLLQALSKVKSRLEKRTEEETKLQWTAAQDRLPYLWKSAIGKELAALEEQKLAEFLKLQENFRLTLVSALAGEEELTCEDARRLFLAETEGAIRVMSYSAMGVSTIFIWSDRTAATGTSRKQTFGKQGMPVVLGTVPSGSKGEALGQAWFRNLRWLDYSYYGHSNSGSSNPHRAEEGEGLSVPWEREQEIIRRFERVAVDECAQKLRELWAFMEDNVMPMVQVKETAERLDRLFARISRKQAFAGCEGLLREVRHRGLLESLLERMFRYAKGRGCQKPEETDHPEINRIIRYLLEHFDEDISLQAMAQLVNMDENYLSGLFKKKTGHTFIGYLQQIRVNEAKVYLAETNLTVAEIGERCGFANPSYFFRIFKRWTGVRPNEYRWACKQEVGS
ncbi:helix-turn-helix domain-containing protein [Paenibacillus caui]|uniref:helix-turn-helix domain-containing protein n=1 Tax=Paenibacillus caui TaxID=2873927 RepID=UPI001CA87010|nr:helix-turn-helix domain-containing protein [Paenibacillus caui]